MSPTPTALGMHLCEYLIVEEATRRVSLINCFSALRCRISDRVAVILDLR